eukprot:6894825-Lingulodinium_polyedra.AAC.1
MDSNRQTSLLDTRWPGTHPASRKRQSGPRQITTRALRIRAEASQGGMPARGLTEARADAWE